MTPTDEQQRAIDFIVKMPKGTVALINSPAGCGKSFIVDRLSELMPSLLLCAFTGNAAQNINGVTYHKLFGIDTNTVFNPEWTYRQYSAHLYGKYGKRAGMFTAKRIDDILKGAQGIVVDEASTLVCNNCDLIDKRLRYVLNKPHEAFGGMRMIFCGDLGQTQPVVDDKEAEILDKMGYKAPYNFLEAKIFNR